MASPAILYRGGEFDSVALESGSATALTDTGRFDTTYSVMAISLSSNILGQSFREPSGSSASVSGGDALWGMIYFSASTSAANGTPVTVYDDNGRPAIRVQVLSGYNLQLQQNTSANSTPSWNVLSSFAGGANSYIVFRLKTGSSKEFSFFVGGNEISSGPLTDGSMSALSRFTIGPMSNPSGVSQIQFSRDVQLVGARVMTRKANAAGTYQQMTGAYSNLVKASLNDTTGIQSLTAGQITTNQYQDVTVPEGLVMHPEVWVWNRVKNSGTEPSLIKQANVVGGVLQKSGNLPVTSGYLQLPSVMSGMNPTNFNSCEIGMESVTP